MLDLTLQNTNKQCYFKHLWEDKWDEVKLKLLLSSTWTAHPTTITMLFYDLVWSVLYFVKVCVRDIPVFSGCMKVASVVNAVSLPLWGGPHLHNEYHLQWQTSCLSVPGGVISKTSHHGKKSPLLDILAWIFTFNLCTR